MQLGDAEEAAGQSGATAMAEELRPRTEAALRHARGVEKAAERRGSAEGAGLQVTDANGKRKGVGLPVCWRRRSRRRRSWSKADARGELADEDEAPGGWR
jgi:hypothetical protein